MNQKNTKLFLSYSRKDEIFAKKIQKHLTNNNFNVFRDLDDTLPGEEWWERLKEIIQLSDSIIFLLTHSSIASDVCKKEIAHAFANKKRIFTLIHEELNWTDVYPELSKIHALNIHENSYKEDLKSLIYMLSTDIKWVRYHTKIGEMALSWKNAPDDNSKLIRGETLKEAIQWAKQKPNSMRISELQIKFIKKSKDNENKEQNKLKEIISKSDTVKIEALTNRVKKFVTNNDSNITEISNIINGYKNKKSQIFIPVNIDAEWQFTDAILTLENMEKFKRLSIERIIFNNIGNKLITLANDNVISVWDADNYKLVFQLNDINCRDVGFSFDSKYVIITPNINQIINKDSSIRILLTDSGKLFKKINVSENLYRVALSYSNKYLMGLSKLSELSYGGWGIANIWDISSGELIHEIGIEIERAIFSDDSQFLYTWTSSNRLKIWNLTSGKEIEESTDNHLIALKGNYLLRTGEQNSIELLNTESKYIVGKYNQFNIKHADISLEKMKLYLFYGGRVDIVNLINGKTIKTVKKNYEKEDVPIREDSECHDIHTSKNLYISRIYPSGKERIYCRKCGYTFTNELPGYPHTHLPNIDKYNQYVESGIIQEFRYIVNDIKNLEKKLENLG